MSKKRKPNQKMRAWIDARKRHRLSHAQVQMARELGMNPKKLGKKDNRDQEPWKMPCGPYIEHLYSKRFGKERPDVVLSIRTPPGEAGSRAPQRPFGSSSPRRPAP